MADQVSDPILAEAIKKRDELDTFIRLYREMAKAGPESGSLALPPGDVGPGLSPFGDVLDPLAVVYPGIFTGKSQTQATRVLLERVKRPLGTTLIVECLAKGGIAVGGKKPHVNLWGVLNRSRKDFVLVPKAGWGLTEWYDDRALAKMRKASKEEAEEENGAKDEAASE